MQNVAIQRRGLMVLLNKSCPLKLVYKEAVDQNCLKLSMKYEVTIYGIFCTYAPCWGLDTDFLLNVRRNQLNSTEDHTAIIGHLNCTLDRVLDKYVIYHQSKRGQEELFRGKSRGKAILARASTGGITF